MDGLERAVSKRSRWTILASLLVVLAIVGAIVYFGGPHEGDSDTSLGDLTTRSDDGGATDGEKLATGDDTGVTADSEGALTETETDASGTSSKRKTPGAPGAVSSPTPPPAGPSAAELWQAYVAETRALVTNNAPDLTSVVAQVTQSLSSGDAAALGALLAPDEGSQAAYIAALADQYPTILTSAPGANVNVYACNGETVYFAYSVVTWTDAGIVSQHTIPIRLRFVNGDWNITTLGDTGSDLQFVQTVTL